MFSEIKDFAYSIESKIIKNRRHIHMNPELGFQEIKTSEYICEKLDELGIPYKKGIAKTGIVATINGELGNGKRIMIRADMDALPMQELNDVPYKSTNDGVMHACGHDNHVAILLGVAEVLNKFKSKFKGTVYLLFQPAEEGPGGARPMVEEGAIGPKENPNIDAALALHIVAGDVFTVNHIGVKDGPMTGSADELYFTIKGKGGHASAPHEGIDPVFIAAQIVTNFQGWLSRNIDPMEPRVFTIGKIVGGTRNNIIPDECKMEGTLRTLNEDVRDKILAELPKFAKNTAKLYGGDAELKINRGYAVGVNSKEINDHIRLVMKEMYEPDALIEVPKAQLGAEDFYEFSLRGKIPVSMFWLGAGGGKYKYPNHSPLFDVDERALPMGASILSATAISYLNSD